MLGRQPGHLVRLKPGTFWQLQLGFIIHPCPEFSGSECMNEW